MRPPDRGLRCSSCCLPVEGGVLDEGRLPGKVQGATWGEGYAPYV